MHNLSCVVLAVPGSPAQSSSHCSTQPHQTPQREPQIPFPRDPLVLKASDVLLWISAC